MRRLAHVGPVAASFFRDACRLMDQDPPLPTTTHLVSHLLREVESALRAVLLPDRLVREHGGDRQRAEVLAILDSLGIDRDDPAAVQWLELTGGDNLSGLAARAHRFGLAGPRPVDDDFRDFFDRVQRMLESVTERFEARYRSVFDQLDALLKTATPTQADAQRLRQRVPHNAATARYFFARASEAWLRPLAREGFFRSPPGPEVGDGSVPSVPDWPESGYLARVAARDPETAVEAAVGIPAVDNAWVGQDLVEVALAVPPEHSVRLVPCIKAALAGRSGVRLPDRVGHLCTHLANGDHPLAALDLMEALLGPPLYRPDQLRSVDAYEFPMIVSRTTPVMVSRVGMDAIVLLLRLLDAMVAADAGRRGTDRSALWRPQIDGETRPDREVRDALVDAIRDGGLDLVDGGRADVASVVAELRIRPSSIFTRLALHLLAMRGQQAPGLVGSYLTDRCLANDWDVEREYLLLARAGCSWASSRDQQRLCALIDGGPDTSSWRWSDDDLPTAQVRRRAVEEWQRDRLTAVERILGPSQLARLRTLVAEHGPAPDPGAEAPPTFEVWSHESPVPGDDLAAMPTGTLVALLRTWQPASTHGRRRYDRSALCEAVRTVMQRDAAARSVDVDAFVGLPVDYVTSVLDALAEALAAKTALSWPAVLRLCFWADQQAVEELQTVAEDQRRSWRRARLAVLRLLILGMADQADPIPADQTDAIWHLIETACADPSPSSQQEARLSDHERLLTLAADSVRPRAIHAAIVYAERRRRTDPTADVTGVLAILSAHLDLWTDPASAVRVTYGSLFARLAALDPGWAASHASVIFPMAPGRRLLWDAAWDPYLARRRVTDEAWELLAEQYRRGVEELDPAEADEWRRARASNLGFHLGNRYWFGQLTLDDHGGLLRRFYERAPQHVRREILESVGLSLAQEDRPDGRLIRRLITLWEFRVESVRAGAAVPELAEFGSWFTSGAFDDQWSLRQLLAVLAMGSELTVETKVLQRLAVLAPVYTQDCLAVLDRWLRSSPKPWRLSNSIDSMRTILAAGQVGDPPTVATAAEIVSRLLLYHGIDLRDIGRASVDEPLGIPHQRQ